MIAEKKMIPLFEPSMTWHETAAVQKVIEGGYLNEGPYVREAEKTFADLVGAKFCLLVPNGALALYLAIQHNNDSHYLIPSYYGIFAANAAKMAGRLVALIDVDRHTASIGPADKEKLLLGQRIPIHTNGRLASTDGATIEDCCQGITHHTQGMLSAYSFHSTKMVTALGGGGALCCDSKDVYEALYALKDHGRPERAQGKPVTDSHKKFGTNLKFLDAQAAFLMAQLKKLPERLERLKSQYRLYQELLGSKVSWLKGEPKWRIDCLVPNAKSMVESLAKHGIQAQQFYLPTHRQNEFKHSDLDFPNTTWLHEHGIYLPSSAKLHDDDIHFICAKIKEELG